MKESGFFKSKNLIKFINVFFLFVIFFVAFSIFVPNFFTLGNMDNLIRQSTIPIILAIGMTLLLISGNFDLSIEGQIACIAMIVGKLVNHMDMDVALAFILAPLIGMAFGLFNGFLSTRIPSFIVTLGTLVITRGIALLVNNSQSLANFPKALLVVSRINIYNIPIFLIYSVVITAIGVILTKKTVFGRQIFAIGGNREAARSCGIPINKNIIGLFVIMGFLCGLCALLLIGRVNAAHPLAMEGASLDTVTAVVIGGTSLFGGLGTVFGSVAGAGFITMLSIVFNLIGVTSAWKRVILGLVLIAVVLFDYFRKKIQERGLR